MTLPREASGAAAAEAGGWRAADYFDLGVIGMTHGLTDGFAVMLVPVLALIVADLGLKPTEAGALLSAFSLAGFLFLTPLSMLADHSGRKKTVLIGGLSLSAAAFVGIGWTERFAAMIGLAFLAGAGNSLYHPCGTALTAERFPEDRAFAISWMGLGGNIGTSSMPLIQAAVAAIAGWRAAVVACALPAAALLPLVGLRFSEGGRAQGGGKGSLREAFGGLFRKVLRNRNVVLLAASYTIRSFGTRGMIGFLPLLAAQKLGMGTGAIGLAVALYFGAGAVTKPIMGWLYARWGARTALFVPLAASGALVLAIAYTRWEPAFLVLACLIGVFSFVSPIVMTATADFCDPDALASSVGFVYTCDGLQFLSPLIAGVLAEWWGLEASYLFFSLAIWAGAAIALGLGRKEAA